MASTGTEPIVSVVILNYNGAHWLDRCLQSLRAQTIYSQIEVILADNASTDRSDELAEKLVRGWPYERFIQHGENLGYCEGNNRAARLATGRFLLFLNNDTWLEPDCLEVLVREVEAAGAQAGTPLVLNYEDATFQSLGAHGIDIFGLSTKRLPFDTTREVFMPEGCSYLVDRRLFEALGAFDPVLFMYSDELDLSWRLWIAGHKAVGVPAARLHHRGAGNLKRGVTRQGEEFRTSDTKRFYANRNGLLVVAKNAQHIWLLAIPLQLALLAVEAIVGLLLVRRWSFIRKAYLEAVVDFGRKRQHILEERARISRFRRRSDGSMLRFLRMRPNRWDEVVRLFRFGAPKVAE